MVRRRDMQGLDLRSSFDCGPRGEIMLLELDPPIALWEGWEDFRCLCPNG